MSTLVLDSQAVSSLALARAGTRPSRAVNALRSASIHHWAVATPAAVLAELYRGGGHDQSLDAFLARYPGVQVVDTDRTLAKLVGHILAAAHRTSADHVDATVVATAALHGRSIILTSDPDDITALVHGHPKIVVEALTD